MKTIVEYLINNHVFDVGLSSSDICAIFNGDISKVDMINSCSLVNGFFNWKHGSTTMITNGEMIIIYNQEDETSLDPDYIIKLLNGERRDASVLLSYFYDLVHGKAEVNKHYKCKLDKLQDNIPILHFGKMDFTTINKPLDLAIFSKETYSDLQIDTRIK